MSFCCCIFFSSKVKTILLYCYGVICVTWCIVTKYLRTSIRFQQKLVTVDFGSASLLIKM